MRVLILTVTAGFGHHATAMAVEAELAARGVEVRILDVYKSINKLMYKAIDKGYLLSTKYTTDAYRMVYGLLERKKSGYHHYNPTAVVNMLLSMKFENFVDAFVPDVIVCTHIFAAQIMHELKIHGKLQKPVVGIITDYTIHPYWETVGSIEKVVLASDLLVYRAVRKGIPEVNLAPLGIPVKPKFSHTVSKEQARLKLGIPVQAKTILLMGGSMGYGNIAELVHKIRRSGTDFYILAVCGNNKKQYAALVGYRDGSGDANLSVYGFIDNVDEMMDAADCIVTKPGGLTISEALCKRLPMVLCSPIPGHEERNVEFLLNNGMALNATKTFGVDEALHYMFHNPERLRMMAESINLVRKPNAGADIADLVISLGQRQT